MSSRLSELYKDLCTKRGEALAVSVTVTIAMWSGPRNISTAMMYAFGNRADCVAWDEPFYAFSLRLSATIIRCARRSSPPMTATGTAWSRAAWRRRQ